MRDAIIATSPTNITIRPPNQLQIPTGMHQPSWYDTVYHTSQNNEWEITTGDVRNRMTLRPSQPSPLTQLVADMGNRPPPGYRGPPIRHPLTVLFCTIVVVTIVLSANQMQ